MIATDQAELLVDQALLREAQDLENDQTKGQESSSSIALTTKEVKKEVKKEEKAAKLAIKVTHGLSSLYTIRLSNWDIMTTSVCYIDT
jgi:hypothetical protein